MSRLKVVGADIPAVPKLGAGGVPVVDPTNTGIAGANLAPVNANPTMRGLPQANVQTPQLPDTSYLQKSGEIFNNIAGTYRAQGETLAARQQGTDAYYTQRAAIEQNKALLEANKKPNTSLEDLGKSILAGYQLVLEVDRVNDERDKQAILYDVTTQLQDLLEVQFPEKAKEIYNKEGYERAKGDVSRTIEGMLSEARKRAAAEGIDPGVVDSMLLPLRTRSISQLEQLSQEKYRAFDLEQQKLAEAQKGNELLTAQMSSQPILSQLRFTNSNPKEVINQFDALLSAMGEERGWSATTFGEFRQEILKAALPSFIDNENAVAEIEYQKTEGEKVLQQVNEINIAFQEGKLTPYARSVALIKLQSQTPEQLHWMIKDVPSPTESLAEQQRLRDIQIAIEEEQRNEDSQLRPEDLTGLETAEEARLVFKIFNGDPNAVRSYNNYKEGRYKDASPIEVNAFKLYEKLDSDSKALRALEDKSLDTQYKIEGINWKLNAQTNMVEIEINGQKQTVPVERFSQTVGGLMDGLNISGSFTGDISPAQLQIEQERLKGISRQIDDLKTPWNNYGINLLNTSDDSGIKKLEERARQAKEEATRNSSGSSTTPDSNEGTPTNNTVSFNYTPYQENNRATSVAYVNTVNNTTGSQVLTAEAQAQASFWQGVTDNLPMLVASNDLDLILADEMKARELRREKVVEDYIAEGGSKEKAEEVLSKMNYFDAYQLKEFDKISNALEREKLRQGIIDRERSPDPIEASPGTKRVGAMPEALAATVDIESANAPTSPNTPLVNPLAKDSEGRYLPVAAGEGVEIVENYTTNDGTGKPRSHIKLKGESGKVHTLQGGKVVYVDELPDEEGQTVFVKTPGGLVEQFSNLKAVEVFKGDLVAPGVTLGVHQEEGVKFKVWTEPPINEFNGVLKTKVYGFGDNQLQHFANTVDPNLYMQQLQFFDLLPPGMGIDKTNPLGIDDSQLQYLGGGTYLLPDGSVANTDTGYYQPPDNILQLLNREQAEVGTPEYKTVTVGEGDQAQEIEVLDLGNGMQIPLASAEYQEWFKSRAPQMSTEGGVIGGGEGGLMYTATNAEKYGFVFPVQSGEIHYLGARDNHWGSDIIGPRGATIVAPFSGTIEYAVAGRTRNTEDSDLETPGHQKQHSVKIKLDNPIEFEGKTIRYVYMTHFMELDPAIAGKTGMRVEAGQVLGKMGWANEWHLHIGLFTGQTEAGALNDPETQRFFGKITRNQQTATNSSGAAPSAANPVRKGYASIHKNDYPTKNNPNHNYGYKAIAEDKAFAKAIAEVADKLNIPAQWLADVMDVETGGTFDPKIRGGAGNNYYGLIQVGIAARKDLGLTIAQVQSMSRAEQMYKVVLPYLQLQLRYARSNNPKAGYNTVEDVAAAINLGHVWLARTPEQRGKTGDANIKFTKYMEKMGERVNRKYQSSYTRTQQASHRIHDQYVAGCTNCTYQANRGGAIIPHEGDIA